ncbi:hypothetical protein EXIGLDRAFT_845692 [Exidia glandulosa HHB12029]|uniref:Mid2 domain-containing protein n=1 Tax=Exidia glandulosa HHB12029 TaxID=1314781 RepID=A0A165BBV9_EXIGL|nr:hypothetical protein EXIGLDRAFT_845692 [Exidia glandulosa HHB12029]
MFPMRWLLLCLAGLLSCAAERIVVSPNDPSIVRIGAGWTQSNASELSPVIPRACAAQLAGPSTTTAGDAFSFSFEGRSVELIMEPRAGHGVFTVSLDGEPFGANYTAASYCRVAYSSPALVPGRHTIHVQLLPSTEGAGSAAHLHLRSLIYDTGMSKRADSSATSASPEATPTEESTDSPLLIQDRPGTLPRRIIAGIALGVAGGIISLTFIIYFVHRSWRRKHPKPAPAIEMKVTPTSKKDRRASKFDQEYFLATPPPKPKKTRRRRRSSARGPPDAVNIKLTPPPLPTSEDGAHSPSVKHKPSVASAVSSEPTSDKAAPMDDAAAHA